MACRSNPVLTFLYFASGLFVLFCIVGMFIASPLGGLILGPLMFLVWGYFWKAVAIATTDPSLNLERAAAIARARRPASPNRVVRMLPQHQRVQPTASQEAQAEDQQADQDFADLFRLF